LSGKTKTNKKKRRKKRKRKKNEEGKKERKKKKKKKRWKNESEVNILFGYFIPRRRGCFYDGYYSSVA